MVILLVSIYIALEILFWPKNKLSEGRGLFGGNVFKNPARNRNVKTESFFRFFYPCIIIIITLSFQVSFCVGILRSRCFLQPSI